MKLQVWMNSVGKKDLEEQALESQFILKPKDLVTLKIEDQLQILTLTL